MHDEVQDETKTSNGMVTCKREGGHWVCPLQGGKIRVCSLEEYEIKKNGKWRQRKMENHKIEDGESKNKNRK